MPSHIQASPERIAELRGLLSSARLPADRLRVVAELARRLTAEDDPEGYVLAREALELAEKLGDEMNVARALNTMGQYHHNRGEIDRAIPLLERSRGMCVGLGLERGMLDATALIAMCRIRQGEYVEANSELEKAVGLCASLNDMSRMPALRNSLAVVRFAVGDLAGAIELHQANLEEVEASGNLRRAALILGNIAELRMELREWDAAVEAFERAVTFLRSDYDPGELARMQARKAECHLSVGRIDDAERCVEELYESISGEALQPLPIILMKKVRARLAMERRDYEAALEFCREAIDCAREHGFRPVEASAMERFAIVLREAGRIDEAISELERASALALDVGDPKLEASLLRERATLLRRVGRFSEAFEALEAYTVLRERLYGEERQRALAEAEIRFRTAQGEKEREILRLKNEHLEAENRGKMRELTTLAMSLTQKTELLRRLQAVLRDRTSASAARRRAELTAEIDGALAAEEGWGQFERQFMLLNPEFISGLADRYPTLTPAELRTCLLLRVNMSTKEISSLLSISSRAVEGHRLNIRRKMGLEPGTSLTTFLASRG